MTNETYYSKSQILKVAESLRPIAGNGITDAFIKGIEGVESWISVKDRMPEEGQGVLGFTGSCTRVALYLGENKWWTDYHDRAITGENLFTHWMPKPEPPKE